MRLFWPIGDFHSGPRMPDGWWIGVHYAQSYRLGIHTGVDFNMHGYADSGKPVRAIADGVIRFAEDAAILGPGWASVRQMVVIEHAALGMWTRYMHLSGVRIKPGETIAAGQIFGAIGDYGAPGKPDDHLHFDMAVTNLGARPEDWPGSKPDAMTRVLRDYRNPLEIFRFTNS